VGKGKRDKRKAAKRPRKAKKPTHAAWPVKPASLVARGWDAVALGDHDEAHKLFSRAAALDPSIADAHNGLGETALSHGDAAAAESAFRQALKLAAVPPPGEGDAWKDPRWRPYLRAREGLARVNWKRHRYEEAAAEYRELLALNPIDTQANRWVIGSLLQLAALDAQALEYYRWFESAYPRDPCEPHMLMNWGLALAESGDMVGAARKWWSACFFNPYVIPCLLGYPVKPHPIEHAISLAEIEYAEFYATEFSELWERAPRSWVRLARLWDDPHTRRSLDRWLGLGRELVTRRDPRTRAPLQKQMYDIGSDPGDQDLSARIDKGWGRGPLVDTLLDGILGLRLKILAGLRHLDRDGIDPAELPRTVVEGHAQLDAILQSRLSGLLTTNPTPADLDETAYVINMLDPMIKHFHQVLYRNIPGARSMA
jgi:tetratricopeptide (TPR) repeat protein